LDAIRKAADKMPRSQGKPRQKEAVVVQPLDAGSPDRRLVVVPKPRPPRRSASTRPLIFEKSVHPALNHGRFRTPAYVMYEEFVKVSWTTVLFRTWNKNYSHPQTKSLLRNLAESVADEHLCEKLRKQAKFYSGLCSKYDRPFNPVATGAKAKAEFNAAFDKFNADRVLLWKGVCSDEHWSGQLLQ
jgi:hypothetical protein